MIGYASRTGTKRNLKALKARGWRLLISRAGVWRTEGFQYALDNGAWSDFQNGEDFDDEAFEAVLVRLGAQADFVVLPDIVAGGLASLELSKRYMNRCLGVCPLVLIAVQDGMRWAHLSPLMGPNVGIFLGGSTDWKLKYMSYWGKFCRRHGCHYHVARVNTVKRIYLAISAGATSFDGSGPSRYAQVIHKLDEARRQQDFFSPALRVC